jgi:uncharacterized membrane protein
MAIKYGKDKTTSSSKLKVFTALFVGLVVALAVGKSLGWSFAPLLGWDAAATVFVIWVWGIVSTMTGAETAAHAVREDPSRSLADAIILVASFASLIAVAIVLSDAANTQGGVRLLEVALGVASVVVSWVAVHTLFMLRYTELYYHESPGGVQFDKTPEPSYHDFAYLSFTIGMTFQVSDTGFQSTEFRRTALRHALISYLFGTVIVATTINLIAGLTK